MNEKINGYFKCYPQSNECFETSDGFLFHDKVNADSHANTLNDKSVQKHSREKIDAFEKVSKVIDKAFTSMIKSASIDTQSQQTEPEKVTDGTIATGIQELEKINIEGENQKTSIIDLPAQTPEASLEIGETNLTNETENTVKVETEVSASQPIESVQPAEKKTNKKNSK